jgi:hypothetical protein
VAIQISRAVGLNANPRAAAYASTQHPDFSILAGRIAVSNLHKNTEDTADFSVLFDLLSKYIHPKVSACRPGHARP